MASNVVKGPSAGALEKTCKKIAEKLKKAAPGEKNEKKLGDLLTQRVCKEIDDKALKALFEQLAEFAKGKSAKGDKNTPKKLTAKPSLKPPGGGTPSLTLPLKKIDLFGDKKKDGKLELKVWADPRDLEKSEKGAAIFFTVKF